MSMVGYILGLGDRHPSNLMMDRATGNILHIDFGDCFEVAMYREKFPEKIPFRLTRMLINAMEVSGIEGNFRFTCENVMRVMRENKQSLMAVLEAFVYDPLLNWRLLTPSPELDGPEEVAPERPPLPGRSRRSTAGANDIGPPPPPLSAVPRALSFSLAYSLILSLTLPLSLSLSPFPSHSLSLSFSLSLFRSCSLSLFSGPICRISSHFLLYPHGSLSLFSLVLPHLLSLPCVSFQPRKC